MSSERDSSKAQEGFERPRGAFSRVDVRAREVSDARFSRDFRISLLGSVQGERGGCFSREEGPLGS